MDRIFIKKEENISENQTIGGKPGKRKTEKMLALAVIISLTLMAVLSGYINKDAAEKDGRNSLLAVKETATTETVTLEEGLINQHEGIIRFHVIANSDSEEDQELKLKVRNNVLAKIKNQLADLFRQETTRTGSFEIDRAAVTRQYIEENIEEIQDWAEEAVKAEGYAYSVTAALGVTQIPAKQYDGVFFPAGNYEALNIRIGEAAGQNWWCVIFPPLCLIDCSDSLFKDRWDSAAGSRILLKSRIKELLDGQK